MGPELSSGEPLLSSKQTFTATENLDKRLKTMSSASSRTQGSKLQVYKDVVLVCDDKENLPPSKSGKRVGPIRSEKKPGSKMVFKGRDANRPLPSDQADMLWTGKQPFSVASPESCTCAKTASSVKSIYELPSVPSRSTSTASSTGLRTIQPKKTSSVSGTITTGRVSRPNKVKTSLKGFSIYKDELDPAVEQASKTFNAVTIMPASTTISNTPSFRSDNTLVDTAPTPLSCLRSNRLVRELTESPLAEVTQAYTGIGKFQISPIPLITARHQGLKSSSRDFQNRVDGLCLDSPKVSHLLCVEEALLY